MSTKLTSAFALVVAFACGAAFQLSLSNGQGFTQKGRYPSSVREQLKEQDVFITIIPQLEEDRIRLRVGLDGAPLGRKTNAAYSTGPKEVWSNVLVGDRDMVYLLPSFDDGLSLRILGVQSSGEKDG